ncbi:thiolase family protein [Xylocopilactobacillus apis]|uniref:acetyl-CoA C-acetyltransferase n=1 Tax=Xylocopilactobacillus apis TaxID=2932183 RepID=A0AAU9DAT1_9LACO|nr:thiolase family protein [Xylocopilactobacillus apis]BDR56790.1 hypothetical protein KIMC2_13520 [Xylocopilactobacillus apis]
MQKKITKIIDAKRSPIGKKGKSLEQLSVQEISCQVVKDLDIDLTLVDSLIMGTVLQTGLGSNAARQVALKSGMNDTSTAQTVNMVCGSGMYALHLADSKIKLQEANLIIAGGAESMSNAPAFGLKNKPTLLNDALEDPFTHDHMGVTAENVANEYHVTRKEQDEFALLSHQKAGKSWEKGDFNKEIVPIKSGSEILLSSDECVRVDSSYEKLSQLKPVFCESGTVTAGNSSPLSDGASFLALASEQFVDDYNLDAKADIVDYVEIGFKPELMGYTPYFAIKELLKRNGLKIQDVDLFEINEAFASQCFAVSRDLSIPLDKLNISGGAIALGHPLGSSGARIVTTLVHNLQRKNLELGVASLCIGGGMACAMLIKNN